MTSYCFTLSYAIDGDPEDAIALLDTHGVTDALVGHGVPGRLALAFEISAADSAAKAVAVTLARVLHALPAARLLRVEVEA